MVSGGSRFEGFAAPITGYGMKEGRLTHISEVSKGLACQCTCVDCHQALVAKKGVKRRHHFARKIESNCQGAAESALHLLSKELIREMTWIELPPYDFHIERKRKSGGLIHHTERITEGERVRIASTIVESRAQGFIADAMLDCFDKQLIVEIAVTHKVDRKKLRHIRRRDLPAIEIQLDPSDALLSREELRNLIQNSHGIKRWLFHPSQRAAERVFVEKFRNLLKDHLAFLKGIGNANRRQAAPRMVGQPQINKQSPVSLNQSKEIHRGMRAPNRSWNGDGMTLRDRLAEEFHRKYNYYPSMEECLRLWPALWRKTPKGRDLQ